MQDFRAFHILYIPQNPCDIYYIVSVDRTEVADIHSFENILLLGSYRFQAIAKANQCLAAVFVEDTYLEEHF